MAYHLKNYYHYVQSMADTFLTTNLGLLQECDTLELEETLFSRTLLFMTTFDLVSIFSRGSCAIS